MYDDRGNIHYNPENYDLEVVGEVEWSEPCWSFDTTVVWRDSTGMFYWASDAGCSCPSPFEDTKFEDLERGSAHDVAAMLNEKLAEVEKYTYSSDHAYAAPQVVELISRVMK